MKLPATMVFLAALTGCATVSPVHADAQTEDADYDENEDLEEDEVVAAHSSRSSVFQ